MSILNQATPPFFETEKERLAHAKIVINLLLKNELLPQRDDFILSRKVATLPIGQKEINKAVEVQDLVEQIFVEDGYAIRVAKSYLIKMTPLGRQLIQNGIFIG